MNFIDDFKKRLFRINDETFEESSLALFEFQYHNNNLYRLYCDSLKRHPNNVKDIHSIPHLPIELFKSHIVSSSNTPTQKIFKSSGTTSAIRSKNHVKDLEFYHEVSRKIFESTFGRLSEYQIIALLPSYQEQGDSSLISMIDHFMTHTHPNSGYFLDKRSQDISIDGNYKTILFGVSYALLDLDNAPTDNLILVETGGMKGRRKELTKEELHQKLKSNLHLTEVWSEYGMTELMSQAYGVDGAFKFPPWATAQTREINDPFSYVNPGKSGGINIIDLANIESCAFIETKDIGIVQKNETFKVLGRFDNSDIRGCNLLV